MEENLKFKFLSATSSVSQSFPLIIKGNWKKRKICTEIRGKLKSLCWQEGKGEGNLQMNQFPTVGNSFPLVGAGICRQLPASIAERTIRFRRGENVKGVFFNSDLSSGGKG